MQSTPAQLSDRDLFSGRRTVNLTPAPRLCLKLFTSSSPFPMLKQEPQHEGWEERQQEERHPQTHLGGADVAPCAGSGA